MIPLAPNSVGENLCDPCASPVSLRSIYALIINGIISLFALCFAAAFEVDDPFGSEFREGKTDRLRRSNFLVDSLLLEQARQRASTKKPNAIALGFSFS